MFFKLKTAIFLLGTTQQLKFQGTTTSLQAPNAPKRTTTRTTLNVKNSETLNHRALNIEHWSIELARVHFSFEIENVNTLSQWFSCLVAMVFGGLVELSGEHSNGLQTNKRISHYLKSHWRSPYGLCSHNCCFFFPAHNIFYKHMCAKSAPVHWDRPLNTLSTWIVLGSKFSSVFFFSLLSFSPHCAIQKLLQSFAHSIGFKIILICDRF